MAITAANIAMLVGGPLAGYVVGAIVLGFSTEKLIRTRKALLALFVAALIVAAYGAYQVLCSAVMLFCLTTFMVSLAEPRRGSIFAFRPNYRYDEAANGEWGSTTSGEKGRPRLVSDNPDPKPRTRLFKGKPQLTVIQGGKKDPPKPKILRPQEKPTAPPVQQSYPMPFLRPPVPKIPRRSSSNVRLASDNKEPERTPRDRSHLRIVRDDE